MILHFAGCAGIAFLTMLRFGNPLLSILVVLVIGTGKELWDKYGKGTFFDWTDIFMDVSGGVFGIWLITMF